MKNLIILFTVAILIFSCAIPENIQKEDSNNSPTNIVLSNEVQNK